MTNPEDHKPDHGEFQLQVNNESLIIVDAIRKASNNIDGAPGRYWARAIVKFEAQGRAREIIRMWGVDIIERSLVTTETEDEVEMARRQRALSETEIQGAIGEG